jgi:hypothetical protein
MTTKDWRSPFLAFREQLLAINDSNAELYHGVLISFRHDLANLGPVVETLEPAFIGKNLVGRISIPTNRCQYHGHFFFGPSNTPFHQLQRGLVDLQQWVDAIPKGLLPRLEVPRLDSQADTNLALWVNLVYQLAFLVDAPYLTAQVEFQENAGEFPFNMWHEWPQPAGCDPGPWLINQGDTSGHISHWETKFQDQRYHLPDIIDAYLDQELIKSSIAAIDVLVFMVDRLQEYATPTKPKKTGHTSGAVTKRVQKDRELVLDVILAHTTKPAPKGEEKQPLGQSEIAEKLGWYNGKGEPNQPKVNRRMETIFGPKPMDAYKELFENGELKQRLQAGAEKDPQDKHWHPEKRVPDEEIKDHREIVPKKLDLD